MDCEKANELMLNFMDNMLSEQDAKKLNEHLNACKGCKESFAVYDQIMTEFMNCELIEAPVGFEACVMQKIKDLPAIHEKVTNGIDNIIYWVLGVFSVFLGVGFIGSMYKDRIMSYIENQPELFWFSQVLGSVSSYVERFTASLLQVSDTAFTTISGYVSSSRYVLLAVFVVLLGVQYLVYKKDKVEV